MKKHGVVREEEPAAVLAPYGTLGRRWMAGQRCRMVAPVESGIRTAYTTHLPLQRFLILLTRKSKIKANIKSVSLKPLKGETEKMSAEESN